MVRPEATNVNETVAGRCLVPVGIPLLSTRPLVSVLVANYNYEHYIGETIESVLNQRYQNFELIIADDVSTDRSREVIAEYAERNSRVKLVERSENGGQAAAWHTAYQHSAGEIICLLDSDDYFDVRKLELLVDCFREHPNSGFALHPMLVVDRDGNAIQQIPFLTRFETGWIADRLVRRGGRLQAMPTSALAFRREIADRIFPIPGQVPRNNADGFIYALAPLLTEVAVVDQPLSGYRVHGTNVASSDRRDATRLRREVDSIAGQITGVNIRLLELGLTGSRLDLRRNLTYRHQKLVLALLAEMPRYRLATDFLALLPALITDDLYGWSNKLLRTLVYGVAISLPASYRARWLTLALGDNGLKQRGQEVLAWLRSAAP